MVALPILLGVNPDAEKWNELAGYDLVTAEAMLASGRYLYVLFCCQQSVEKRLKGLIVDRTGAFPPRTHDLGRRAEAANLQLAEDQDLFLRRLTKYYIGTRYPEEVSLLSREATQEVATHLLKQTKDIVTWIETLRN
jgi:HEPN domain-containing protein